MNSDILSNDCPSYSSIVAKNSKGDLWLDNNKSPTIAIAYSYCVGGYGILGIYKNSKLGLRCFLEKNVFPVIKESGKTVFEFSTENTDIEKEMLSSFNSKNIKNELEYSYRLKTRINKANLQSPSYEIVKVSKSLLRNIENYENYAMLTNRIDNSWYSRDDFLCKSLAYIALNQNSIVGVCFGSALYNGYITVDIETDISHRRKGIASTLVKNFVNEAISRNYIVQWDRVESNVASKLLAEKFGFNLFKVRPYYWFKI